MNKSEVIINETLGTLSAIEQDMRLKSEAYQEFVDKLFAEGAKPLPFTRERVEAMRMVVAVVQPGMVDQAVEQVQVIGSYLSSIHLPGLVLCSLACGILPANNPTEESEEILTLWGEPLIASNPNVRDVFWLLRRWQHAEENIGLVDFIVFFRWCVENDIETNFLRLMYELTGTGPKRMVGILPFDELVKYGVTF